MVLAITHDGIGPQPNLTKFLAMHMIQGLRYVFYERFEEHVMRLLSDMLTR